MKLTAGVRASSLLSYLLMLCAPVSGTAQAAAWNGWARCELQIAGPGYTNNETHTWMISNVTSNLPSLAGPGTWSVAGSGSLFRSDGVTSERGEWSIAGSSTGGRFIAEVASGVARIRPVHSQLRQSNGIVGYTQQSISGNPRSPTTISATAWEWPFPLAQGPASGQTISGSSVATSSDPWGIQQPFGSTRTANCQWSFADGSVPPPPPPVNAPPPPVPPTQPPPGQQPPPSPVTAAQYSWTGFVECEASAGRRSQYQETQLHRWELKGAAPTPSGGGFEHRAEWSVKGNGSSRSRIETASWTTSGSDKAPFFMWIRASDDKLVIQRKPPPRVLAGGLRGTRQATTQGSQPEAFSLDARELPLPVIESDSKEKRFKGQSSTPLAAKLSPRQPTNATGTSVCRWDFQAKAP